MDHHQHTASDLPKPETASEDLFQPKGYDFEDEDGELYQPYRNHWTSLMVATAHHDQRHAVHLALLGIAAHIADRLADLAHATKLLEILRRWVQGEATQRAVLAAISDSARNHEDLHRAPEVLALTRVADAAWASTPAGAACMLAQSVWDLAGNDAEEVQAINDWLGPKLRGDATPEVLAEIDVFAERGDFLHANQVAGDAVRKFQAERYEAIKARAAEHSIRFERHDGNRFEQADGMEAPYTFEMEPFGDQTVITWRGPISLTDLGAILDTVIAIPKPLRDLGLDTSATAADVERKVTADRDEWSRHYQEEVRRATEDATDEQAEILAKLERTRGEALAVIGGAK